MRSLNFNKVLVFSPHSDDGELGVGGTVSRMLEEEKEVHYVSFYTSPTLRRECKNATQSLGILPKNIVSLDYTVRHFPEYRQRILDEMIHFRDTISPDLVLCPSSYDVHQDHQIIHVETLRAFKTDCSIWGYEHPWNNFSFTTDIFVRLEEHHIEKKISALGKYTSQAYRPYMTPEYIRSLARVRGLQIKYHLAEAFEMLRVVF